MESSVDTDQVTPSAGLLTSALYAQVCLSVRILRVNMVISGMHDAKACLRAYADRECSNQTAHLHSLIRAFAVRRYNHLRKC